MKRLICIFLVFCSVYLPAQTKSQDIGVILQNMKSQETSWNNGDIKGFMAYYLKSDSLMFIGSKGVTYGWQNTLDNYTKNYPDKKTMGTLRFIILKTIQLSPESIYLIGKWDLARDKPIGGHFTLLWKKVEGQWVIVSDHTS